MRIGNGVGAIVLALVCSSGFSFAQEAPNVDQITTVPSPPVVGQATMDDSLNSPPLAVAPTETMGKTAVASASVVEKRDAIELSLSDLMNLTVEGISKGKQPYRETPMSVYVIGKDELDRWGIRNFYDIFQRVPGYSYYNTDTYGANGPIGRGLTSIWKFGFSMELMNMVDFGHYQLTPHFFKSIEVARGPAGLMWGTSAFGGLTNFNFRDDLRGAETYTEMGNDYRFVQDVVAGNVFNDGDPGDGYFAGWRYEQQDPDVQKGALTGLRRQSDDYKSDGINPSQTIVGKIQYKGLKLVMYSDHSNFVAPVMWIGLPAKDQYLNRWVTDTLTKYQGPKFGDQQEVLNARIEYTLPFKKYIDPAFPVNLAFYHETYKKEWTMPGLVSDVQRKETYGVRGEAAFLQNDLNMNFGGDIFGRDQVVAPSYTSKWAQTYMNWNKLGVWNYPETRYHNAYLQGSYKVLGNLSVLAGGRIDWVDSSTYGSLFSGPRVGVMYSPVDNMTFKYLYNSSARPPAGNEENSVRNGGGALNPERLTDHEITSTMLVGDDLEVDLSLFYQRTQDAIVVDPNTIAGTGKAYSNFPGSKNIGFEWAIKSKLAKFLLVSWNGSYNHLEVMNSTVKDSLGNNKIITEPHNGDNQPIFVPTATSYLNFDYNLRNWVHLSPALRYIYRIPYVTLQGTNDLANAYFLDLTISSKKFFDNHLDFSITVLNLLDFDRGLPAYGEHLGNPNGTVIPESRKYSAIMHLVF